MSIRMEMWLAFAVVMIVSIALDLGMHRKEKDGGESLKSAVIWSIVWIALALLFNAVVYGVMGRQRGTEFLTAFLIEKSLSVDNLFVFLLVFEYFKIPTRYQPKALTYGILGAMIMRVALLLLGVELTARFHWIFYIFGVVLIVTAIRMVLDDAGEVNPESNFALRLFKKFMPFSTNVNTGRFVEREGDRLKATPLMATLLVLGVSDLVFAIDSIPAVLAISQHPFIVVSSNVFAVLGMRALYFVLKNVVSLFRFLKYGLAVVLIFIGAKMLLMDIFPIHTGISLGVVIGCLAVSMIASVAVPKRHG